MRVSCSRKILQAVAMACLGAVFSVVLLVTGFFGSWEDKVWDVQSRFFAEPSPHTEDIVLVLLDQASLEWVHKHVKRTWLWPRELFAAIIANCNRHGAKAVGFDTLFTEPSTFGVFDDRALAEAIAESGQFAAGSVFPSHASGKHFVWPPSAPAPFFSVVGDSEPENLFPVFPRATMPIVDVAQHAGVLCNVHQDPDEDGIYRSLFPLVYFDSNPLPTLGLGTYLLVHPHSEVSLAGRILTVGSAKIPLDEKGQALLRFRGLSGSYPRISAATLIAEEMGLLQNMEVDSSHAELLAGKYVLFGFSAPGLFDLRPTPMGGVFSGVEINATFLDNLLNDDFMIPLSLREQAGMIVCIVTLTALVLNCLKGPFLLSVASLVLSCLPLICSCLFFKFGYRMEVLSLESGVGMTIFFAHFLGFLQEGKQRRFIKHSFRHYLSPDVIDQLIQNPDRLRLGGDRKELSIFFSDLQGFTTISEGMEPEDLTNLLNLYLSAMTDIILEEKGTVDKYEGDAIIAFWNAPLSIPDHAERAVRSALRCQEKLLEMRDELYGICGHILLMRIGVNSGPAVVGNLGSSMRFDYTMLGDAVNLAARLEGANKQFGSYTMISSSTYKLIDGCYPCRELARLAVVGRSEAVVVYEPYLDGDYQKNAPVLKEFSHGLSAFYAGDFVLAKKYFASISGVDPPASSYEVKCQLFCENPPSNWDGVWTLTSK